MASILVVDDEAAMRGVMRRALERAGHTVAEAENLLSVMDDVYTLLVTIDYPEALTGGLRRASDALRGVLERTRGDVTNALVMSRMQDAICGGPADRAG